jgi:hypothetical protein
MPNLPILRLATFALCTTVIAHSITAQSPSTTSPTPAAKFVDSIRVEIDAAVEADDNARLDKTFVLMDRALTAFPGDPYLLHYRGYANYRKAVNFFRANNLTPAAPIINAAIRDLQQSSDKLKWAETYSLLSTLQGFRIGMDPSLGQQLGAEIGQLTGEALRIHPNNPRVLLMMAYGSQNAPPEYGGGIEKARQYAQQALAAFDTFKPAPLAPTWGKAETQELLKTLRNQFQ